MLHQEILFRFEEPEVILPRAHTRPEPDAEGQAETAPADARMSRLALAAAVFGNVLLGTAFLGTLLLLPRLLAWWLMPG